MPAYHPTASPAPVPARQQPGSPYVNAISLLLFVLIAVCGCLLQARAESDLKQLVIHTLDGRELIYQVEVADTDAARTRGLMYRENLPAQHGMLFDFKRSKQVSFWMKNTYIPLDMLFIDKAGVIVKIAENTEPLSTEPISSGGNIRYVLELNARQAASRNINTGDSIELEP